MASISKLRQKFNNVDHEMKKEIGHIGTMAKDAERVSKIAENASLVINDIDRKFEETTKLTGIDVTFLFLAVALQVARQYLVTNFKEREGDKKAEEKIKKHEDKIKKYIMKNKGEDDNLEHLERSKNWYNPPLNEVLLNPVPFDTSFGSPDFGLNLGDHHRIRTLGHDPILGWIFGTMNIATSTITLATIIPPLQSFHVRTGNDSIGRAKDKIT